MPDSQAQPAASNATLELDGGVRLTGDLTAQADGRLQLGSTRLQKGSAPGGRVSLRPGTRVTLSLSSGRGEVDTSVTVAGISGNNITLAFTEPDSEDAKHFRDVLAGTKPNVMVAASAEFSELLSALQEQSLSRLENLLKPFLKELKDYLLDLSSRTKQPKAGQNLHYEASVIIRGKTKKITRDFLRQIAAHYDNLTPDQVDDQPTRVDAQSTPGLDLVDIQEFEDFLAIDRIITRGEEQFHVPLEALVIRTAKLIDADPHKLRLPVHVKQLCRALQPALDGQQIPREVLPHIFDFFARQFISELGDYYRKLNEALSEGGVLPGLEREIEIKGSLLQDKPPARKPSKSATSEHQGTKQEHLERPTPDAAQSHNTAQTGSPPQSGGAAPPPTDQGKADHAYKQLGEQVAGAIGRFSPENLYSSVINALNFKRAADGLSNSDAIESGEPLSGTWDGAAVASSEVDQHSLADAETIARALGSLQRSAEVRSAVQQSDSLREYLANNKGQLGELKDTTGLTAESLNQLDMVDNLFGTISSQLDVAAELKPALGNLQIPLAKLALLDPRFMQDRAHTARSVVDKLTHLASSANFPNRALESRVNAIVEEIITDYETDGAVFDSALHKIDKLVAQQERALSRNIERVVRTQEGQEKLNKARQAVDTVIDAIIQPPSSPQVLVDLIDRGWRDLLVLTHIKEGPTSQAWDEHLKTLDLLKEWLEERQRGIDEEGMLQHTLEAETLIEMIGQQITTALPTNVSHEAVLNDLRAILSGDSEILTVDVAGKGIDEAAAPEEVRAKIEDLPRLRRWVKRVEQLEKDTWLAYRDKDNKKRRMQLAWISEARDRYIFVNERGQKMADLSSVQLARQLSKGVQPPAPADKLSVVDQSMYQTLEHVQKTLSFARNHDSLTKLINRRTFENQMERALRHAQVKYSQHAVLYLNIDQFSLVNDVYDRINGDQVLLEFARLLAQLHGKKSSSARMQSDEFGVLLLDRNLEQAGQMAEKIRADIQSSSVDIEGEQVTFTVSIGVAPIVEHSASVSNILESARSALHTAKEQGRNRVVQFEEDQDSAGTYKKEKSHTLKHLEETLATERFVLRAQPIVQTSVNAGFTTTDGSHHYELLLGLSNKDGSLSSPEEFIRSAERYGFMTLVDRWVVREAFAWISELMDAQKVIPSLAINLSGTSVTDDSFMEYLFEQISEFGVGTSRLCFEITETGTISNLVKAADFVRAFRNIGCKFSIDDFGTGLASHNYLRELPVDYVKIDGTFITNIHTNRNDYAMARSINDLAHFLGQETIAESVENDEIINTLREIGVDYLQGWGIGKPKLLSEVTKDLSSIEK